MKLLTLVLAWLAIATVGCSSILPTKTDNTNPVPATQAPTSAPTQVPPPTKAPAPTATTTPTATSAPTATTLGDPKSAVLQGLAAQLKTKSFHVTSISLVNGKTTTRTVDYVAPDRYHIKTDTMDVILIGDKLYTNTKGKWALNPAMSGLVKPLLDELRNIPVDITDVHLVGPDVVNGVPTVAIMYASTITVGKAVVKSTSKAWLRVSDGLPVKQEIDSDVGGVKTHISQTIDYDSTLKIDAPA
jgi:hypothetical protein